MDLAHLRRLLDRAELMRTLERHRGRDTRIADWLHHLEHQHGGIEDSGARVEVIPGSGHATPYDRPEAFNRLLLEFLAAH